MFTNIMYVTVINIMLCIFYHNKKVGNHLQRKNAMPLLA